LLSVFCDWNCIYFESSKSDGYKWQVFGADSRCGSYLAGRMQENSRRHKASLAGRRLTRGLFDWSMSALAIYCSLRKRHSLELRILRLGLLQHWNVGVGVFPYGEEVLVGGMLPHRLDGGNRGKSDS
jgi:hypothetical protein